MAVADGTLYPSDDLVSKTFGFLLLKIFSVVNSSLSYLRLPRF